MVSPNLLKSLELGDELELFVEDRVRSGEFSDAKAVIRAGLSLLERVNANEADISATNNEDSASGKTEPFDLDAFLKDRHGLAEALERGEASNNFREIDFDRLMDEVEAEAGQPGQRR